MPAEIDAETLAAARRGDDRALGRLIEHYKSYVYTLAYRVVRDSHEAEDVAQETFIKVVSNLRRFRGDAKFSVWLYRVVYNTAINRLKKKPLVAEPLLNEEGDEVRLAEGTDAEHPARVALSVERRAMVRRAVEKLPQEYRVAVTCYYLDELSYNEIADVMGVPLGTVKTYLSRSKDALRKILSRGEFGDLKESEAL